MKHSTRILLALLFLLLISCQDSKTRNYVLVSNETSLLNTSAGEHPGKKLMETKCYICHHPSADHDQRIAPPMVAIKSHYITDDISKNEFSNAIWEFVKKPSKEKSRMRGAVRRFGVMPYQPFTEEEIKSIAEYMFDHKIEEPTWFKKHIEEESNGKMKHRNEPRK